MDFKEWFLNTFGETVESAVYGHEMGNYTGPPDPHSIKIAWQAATLAERERAAKVADNQVFEDHVDCEGCSTAKEIAATIRKGEGA